MAIRSALGYAVVIQWTRGLQLHELRANSGEGRRAKIEDYNRERPHQAHSYRTPSEVSAGALYTMQSAA
jgi:hypothetical protein